MSRLLRSFAVAAVALLWATGAVAQTRTTLQGMVTDADGVPLIGATVRLDGTAVGDATNADGRYAFETTLDGAQTLVATYIGYERREMPVTLSGGTQTHDFQLGFDALEFGTAVVTGVVNPTTKLESATSITTLGPAAIEASAPRTTAEIFRTIPGIRSEASGGDGNTNITVRGVPISAGGSRYLQLQEDGLPVLLFGDIAFATSDIFLRSDASLARLEAVRGGAASTLASNSPAGLLNFISKTGETAGGSLTTSAGLDYETRRVDFEYGSPLGDDLAFHVGGFYRAGSGTRNTGYLAENGGQFRANLTRRFESGYARIYLKYLNDRTPGYLPMPVQVSGTNADPTWENAPGFSATGGAPHSVYFQQNYGYGAEGQRRLSDIADGMHPVQSSLGAEFLFDVAGWTVQNRARGSLTSGRFVSPFPSNVGPTADIVAGAGTAVGQDFSNAILTYADDTRPLAERERYTGGLLQSIVLFDTELRNFNNFFNDAQVSRTFADLSPGTDVSLTGGLFTGGQRINMAWLWNSYLLDVDGENARLIDVSIPNAADTTAWSQDGLFAYGAAPFGNCCAVAFNSTYNVTAPYAAVSVETAVGLSLDASIRYDIGSVSGVGSGGTVGPNDVSGDGVIQPVEQAVNRIDFTQRNPVDYDYSYVSYSVGANYLLTPRSAVFARASQGAAAQADRVIFPSGTYVAPVQFGTRNKLFQAELGYKQQFPLGGLFVTGFYAITNEAAGFEATTQQVIENDYRALGTEIEATIQVSGLDVRGAATVTAAEITSGDNDGNRPRRQPVFAYSLVPTYRMGPVGVGLGVIGQTSSYAQDTNELVMPAYALVNGFVNVDIAAGLALGLSANNLLDASGFTESEEGAITEGQVNYLRARSVTGRTILAQLRYTF